MHKRSGILLFLIFSLVFISVVQAADKAVNTQQAKNAAIASKAGSEQKPKGPLAGMKSNFTMLSGAITNIDMADPAKIKIEIKSDGDNQIHVIEVTPATNVTKVTDVSELKIGEPVRVMSRKIDDKEVAMGVMFGKLKKLPAPPKLTPAQAVPDLKTPPTAAKSKPRK